MRSPYINRVTLSGVVVQDPSVRTVKGDRKLAILRVANNNRFKDQAGSIQTRSTFVDCVGWGKVAEIIETSIAKKMPVFIEGSLSSRQVTRSTDGVTYSKTEITIQCIQALKRVEEMSEAVADDPVASGDMPEF